MYVALGQSFHPDDGQALAEVLDQCRKGLNGRIPCLGILFTSRMDMPFELILTKISDEWPDLRIVGCTTDGEITDVMSCTSHSLSLLLLGSEQVLFSTGLGENVSRNPRAALRKAFADALSDNARQGNGTPRLGIVFGDGLLQQGVDFAASCNTDLGLDFPLFGALAGDDFRFDQTFQFHNRRVLRDGFVVAVLSGPVQQTMSFGLGHNAVGKTFTINKSKGNIVEQIDGLPATDFYAKYYGPHIDLYPKFPLAVLVNPHAPEEFILRDPLVTDLEKKTIAFCGTFPPQAQVRLTEFTNEGLIAAAISHTLETLDQYPGCPDLALVCPCTSRQHILGSKAAYEHAALLRYREAHPGMRIFGMYAYGEIGPLRDNGPILFHDASYAMLLLGEST